MKNNVEKYLFLDFDHQLHTISELCGYHLANHHHALADAEACAWIAKEIL